MDRRQAASGRARRLRRAALLAAAIGPLAVTVSGAQASNSAYKAPAAGTWKVDDSYHYDISGSAKIGRGGTTLSSLQFTLGTETCAGAKSVTLARAVKIKRVGSYKRPAVGRLLRQGALITPLAARVKVDGKAKSGRLLIVFNKTGRWATGAKLTIGSCKILFVLSK